jgi:hypothetical protein
MSAKRTSGSIGTAWVYIEIHDFNAGLSLTMMSAAVPFAVAKFDIRHLDDAKAFPLTFGGKSRTGITGELICERVLPSLSAAQYRWTESARITPIQA